MKHKLLNHFLCLAFVVFAATATAADKVRYRSSPPGMMKIDGTSTIHDWSATTKLIGGSFLCDSSVSLADTKKLKPGKFDGTVSAIMPANSFSCSSGSKMDEVMRKAMNADKHKLISYKSTELTVKSVNADGSVVLGSKGTLTVSGVAKPISMDVIMTASDGGKKVAFAGKTSVKMTDHGIKPPAPSVGLGLIKTGDEVTLTFEWKTVRAD